MFRMLSGLLGPRWRPYSVRFTHAAPKDLATHRRVFDAEVQFDSDFNGFVCPISDLDRPNPTADATMAQYARRYVDGLGHRASDATALEVRKAVILLLPVGRASIAQVAKWLGVNVRTLQRRLSAEGDEFSSLLNDVRRELALRYLANPALSMIEVARLLGYNQPSSLSRWFASEFGAPPTRWTPTSRGAAPGSPQAATPLAKV
jgi:AraC-like DNA-binding protein